jgi:uncharacterized damage-inducible protein DinB
MTEQQSTLTTFYNDWNDYQSLLIKALTPLILDQLDMRAAPQLRSIREIVTHMIGALAHWFHDLVGEGDLEFAALGSWDRKGCQRAVLLNWSMLLRLPGGYCRQQLSGGHQPNGIRPTWESQESQLHLHLSGHLYRFGESQQIGHRKVPLLSAR